MISLFFFVLFHYLLKIKDDSTALMAAAREGHAATVEILIRAGARVNCQDFVRLLSNCVITNIVAFSLCRVVEAFVHACYLSINPSSSILCLYTSTLNSFTLMSLLCTLQIPSSARSSGGRHSLNGSRNGRLHCHSGSSTTSWRKQGLRKLRELAFSFFDTQTYKI